MHGTRRHIAASLFTLLRKTHWTENRPTRECVGFFFISDGMNQGYFRSNVLALERTSSFAPFCLT